MKSFIIENEFWELFPQAQIGIVLCKNIDNQIKDGKQYEEMLTKAQEAAKAHFTKEEFSSNTVIAVWREAFQKFKTKKGARASIEALLKRVHNGSGLGTINPLVDIYNAISLRYALPCGGEDIDRFEGDIRLTRAVGDEEFLPLGSEENAPPYEGEVVYKDAAGAICRCWNWREAQRTMLTEATQNAFLCVELVDESRKEQLLEALEELAALVPKHLGGTSEIFLLDREHSQVKISE